MSRKVSLTDAEQDYLLKLVQKDRKQLYPDLVKKLTRPRALNEKEE